MKFLLYQSNINEKHYGAYFGKFTFGFAMLPFVSSKQEFENINNTLTEIKRG